MVYRIYVEKKEEFANEAKSLKNDFSEVAEGSHAMISNEFDARNLLAFLKTASQTGMSNR